MKLLPYLHDEGLSENRAFPTRAAREGTSSKSADGLIIRLTSESDSQIIGSFLSRNANVLALYPVEWTAPGFCPQAVERANLILEKWGGSHLVSGNCLSNDQIWYELTVPKGRLFLTNDQLLADGSYMNGYGRTLEKTKEIERLQKELRTFKKPFLVLSHLNTIETWPAHVPMTLEFDVVNAGPKLSSTKISFELAPEFEAMSGLDLVLPTLSSRSKVSLAVQVVPRVSGEYKDFLRIITSDNLSIKAPQMALKVTPSIQALTSKRMPQDSAHFDALKRVAAGKHTIIDDDFLQKLPSLASVDAAACLNRLRTVSESLLRNLTGRKNKSFAENINHAQANKLLDSKSIGYLNTIRTLGNIGSHPSEEGVTDADVRVASYALASVLEDLLRRGFPNSPPQVQ